MELAGNPYQEERSDDKGAMGWVWMFPLRRAGTSKSPELLPNRQLPYGCYAVIGNERDATKLEAINQHLDALKELGVGVLDQRDVNQDRWESAMVSTFEQVTHHMEQYVKRAIREQKRRTSRSNLRWGFDPDELEFDGTEERVMEVLKILGREAEFDQIRNAAERLVKYPDPAEF